MARPRSPDTKSRCAKAPAGLPGRKINTTALAYNGGMKEFLPSLESLQSAAAIVYQTLSPTPQYAWPLLKAAIGTQTWVKHENHLPVGSFKLRGGLVYF